MIALNLDGSNKKMRADKLKAWEAFHLITIVFCHQKLLL
jgi:hypothetical protein